MKSGTVERKVTEDFLPGGPRERTITYEAPFDCCDREQDYLDDAKTSQPLEELLNRFQPKEVRLLLPRDRDGTVCCSKELFKFIGGVSGVSWEKLPTTMLPCPARSPRCRL